MRRHYVASTSLRRYFDVMHLLDWQSCTHKQMDYPVLITGRRVFEIYVFRSHNLLKKRTTKVTSANFQNMFSTTSSVRNMNSLYFLITGRAVPISEWPTWCSSQPGYFPSEPATFVQRLPNVFQTPWTFGTRWIVVIQRSLALWVEIPVF